MAYRKHIVGDQNQANETASHNRIQLETGSGFKVLAIFFCIVCTACIIFVAVLNLRLVESLVIATFVGVVVSGWLFLISFTARNISATKTSLDVDAAIRTHALLERNVIYATDHYILYKDQDGAYQFQGSVTVNENRTIQPQLAPPVSHQETILELFDRGMSGRSIEKLLKDKKVSFREISKTLDLYRPDWTRKKIVDSDLTTDSDETPV
jgi:hypothetical protein